MKYYSTIFLISLTCVFGLDNQQDEQVKISPYKIDPNFYTNTEDTKNQESEKDDSFIIIEPKRSLKKVPTLSGDVYYNTIALFCYEESKDNPENIINFSKDNPENIIDTYDIGFSGRLIKWLDSVGKEDSTEEQDQFFPFTAPLDMAKDEDREKATFLKDLILYKTHMFTDMSYFFRDFFGAESDSPKNFVVCKKGDKSDKSYLFREFAPIGRDSPEVAGVTLNVGRTEENSFYTTLTYLASSKNVSPDFFDNYLVDDNCPIYYRLLQSWDRRTYIARCYVVFSLAYALYHEKPLSQVMKHWLPNPWFRKSVEHDFNSSELNEWLTRAARIIRYERFALGQKPYEGANLLFAMLIQLVEPSNDRIVTLNGSTLDKINKLKEVDLYIRWQALNPYFIAAYNQFAKKTFKPFIEADKVFAILFPEGTKPL